MVQVLPSAVYTDSTDKEIPCFQSALGPCSEAVQSLTYPFMLF
jgi:hypothetical protein